MTTRSRLWASLAVALAMVLAAGLGVAGPAAADTGGGEPTATEAELGAVLDVQYEPQPDGYIEITEYENATEVLAVAADCEMRATAYKPTRSGSKIRGTGSYSLSSGCGSSPFEVIFSIEIYVGGYWLELSTFDTVTVAPANGSVSTSANCKRGAISTELLVQRGINDAYSTSEILTVKSC